MGKKELEKDRNDVRQRIADLERELSSCENSFHKALILAEKATLEIGLRLIS